MGLPELRVSNCAIVVPLEADAPVALDWLAVQEKVAPETRLDNAKPVVPDPQKEADDGAMMAAGIGFTVTTTS